MLWNAWADLYFIFVFFNTLWWATPQSLCSTLPATYLGDAVSALLWHHCLQRVHTVLVWWGISLRAHVSQFVQGCFLFLFCFAFVCLLLFLRGVWGGGGGERDTSYNCFAMFARSCTLSDWLVSEHTWSQNMLTEIRTAIYFADPHKL